MKKMFAMMTLCMTMFCAMTQTAAAGCCEHERAVDFGFYNDPLYQADNHYHGGVDFGFYNDPFYSSGTDDYGGDELVEVWQDCPACYTGTCRYCNGRGWYTNPYGGGGRIECEPECTVCDGEGGYYTYR